MPVFRVNGREYDTDSGRLMDFLRDTLRLTSVKDGCSEGACGACIVLIDGEAKKACVQRIEKLGGKSIVTVEGLNAREKQVYSHAFAEAGAVQCGFCTPGMIISAKALLDKNPSPTPGDVKRAIRNNICRCTGYKKIETAILMAADIFAGRRELKEADFSGRLGEAMPRPDAYPKALGEAEYADDIHLDGMLYGGAKRPGVPRALIKSIDTSEAKALDGVFAVLTAEDIPGQRLIGHLKRDWDVLIPVGGKTRYVGDSVALVAADSRDVLEKALSLIRVEYDILPPITSPAQAMRADAPALHEGGNLLSEEHLIRGDADAVIQKSAYKVTEHYSLPFTEHAFLEPECAVAFPEDGGVHIISGDQGIYQTQRECSEMLGLPADKVRVSAALVGGGFGGKEDMSVQHHAALLCYAAHRPVKVRLSRAESLAVHPKRHAMEIDMTTACDKDGYITAMKAVIISDTGAYASLGGPVLQRACTHAAGPYNFSTIDILGRAYYTNNPPAGAFRGFGVPQSCFAAESNLDRLAALLGITPFEIRYKNAIRPGQYLPNGQLADETTAMVEALDAVRPYVEADPSCGIACALKNSGLGVGVPDTGRCRIEVRGGSLHLYSSAACIGQGMGVVQQQMVCSVTGMPPARVIYHEPDTALSPNSGNTTASRQTLFTGEAAVRAAKLFVSALEGAGSIDTLEGKSFIGEYTGVTDKLGSDKPHPISHIAYGYAVHVAFLDEDGRLGRIIAAHDVGRAVNPVAVEGQIEGGTVMGAGYALTEDYPLRDGVPTAKFGTLGLFKADAAPDITPIIIEKSEGGLALGAKGIGEISAIPTAPAIALAYYHRDGVFRTSLPLKGTPYERRKKE